MEFNHLDVANKFFHKEFDSLTESEQSIVRHFAERTHIIRNVHAENEDTLKAEMEILSLHEKIDQLHEKQMTDVIATQQEQINLIRQMLDTHLAELQKTSNTPR